MVALGSNYGGGLRFPVSIFGSSGARANVSLNAAYVHGTSGPAVAVRYQARTADPINELYVMLDDIIGTLASITMGCVLYNEHATSATQPGPTTRATASAVTMPSAVDKWIKVAFGTPYTPTVGEVLWFVLFNTSAVPATNAPLILGATNILRFGTNVYGTCLSTVAGFSTTGTAQSQMPFVVKQGSNYYGMPLTTNNNSTVYTTSAAMRGFQITPPVDIEVSGWQSLAGATAFSGIRIYNSATPPAGAPLYTYPLGTDTNQNRDEIIGSKVWAPIILTGGVTYNVVATFGASVALTSGNIEDYASFPTVFDGLIDGFVNCASVMDNGGAWYARSDAHMSHQLIVTGFPPPSGGGGGGGNVKYWNGSAWVASAGTRTWNGSAWVVADGAAPTAPATSLLTSFTPGTDRNDFTGQVGVRLGIGASPFTIDWIGARRHHANQTGVHVVKLYEWFADALVATANIDYTGVAVGGWAWTKLGSPVTLPSGGYFALLMDVTASDGQTWCNPGAATYTGMANVYDCYRVPASGLSTGTPNDCFIGLDLGSS